MLRTTIYLEEETVLALRRLSEVHGRSQSDMIREAITSYVDRSDLSSAKILPPGSGRYRSGRADVSATAETILKRRFRSKR